MSESEWIDIFSKNLREIMNDYRYTQRDLADTLGVAESTVSRYLKGQMAPSIFAVINMSYALGCTIDELIDFGDRIR